MATNEHIIETGIYENEDQGCFEAWVVVPDLGRRILVGTCSSCVSQREYDWWVQSLYRGPFCEWGVRIHAAA